MARETPCKTPGATFKITIGTKGIEVVVLYPMEIDMTVEEAIDLENTLHNAVEMALAPVFQILAYKQIVVYEQNLMHTQD